MVSYLFANSTAYPMQSIPVAGDAGRGEELVASVGCMACHQSPEETAGSDTRTATSIQDLRRQFGPNFQGLGEDLGAVGYNWLRIRPATIPAPACRACA